MKKNRIAAAALASVLAAVTVPFQPVMAEEETVETLTYGVLSYHVTEKNYYEDAHITITGCDTSATEVTIPAEIDGIPVKYITDSTFEGCDKVTSLRLPDNFWSLSLSNLEGLTSLTEIHIPEENQANFRFTWDEDTPLPDTPIVSVKNGIVCVADYAVGAEDKDTLTEAVIPEGIRYICARAFSYCFELTSATIASSVEAIGRAAFGDPNPETGDDGTGGLSSLQTVTIAPDSKLTSVGNYAFCGDTAVTEIALPDTVEYIGDYAFAYTSLNALTLSSNLTYLGQYALDNMEVKNKYIILSPFAGTAFDNIFMNINRFIPDEIGEKKHDVYFTGTQAEWDAIDLVYQDPFGDEIEHETKEEYDPETDTTIQVPIDHFEWSALHLNCSVVTEGDYTFVLCPDEGYAVLIDCDTTVTEITIPAEAGGYPVTEIAPAAFRGCSEITELVIPEHITKICDDAFDDCTKLEKLTLNGNAELPFDYDYFQDFETDTWDLQERYSFEDLVDGCHVLKTVEQTTDSDTIRTYHGAVYTADGKTLLYYPEIAEEYTFLPGVEKLAAYSMESCQMETLTLPDTVKEIGSYAFTYCSNLTHIDLPSSLEIIQNNAFGACVSLQEIEIPTGTKEISSEVFYNCLALEKAVIPSTVEEIGYDAFVQTDPDGEYSWSSKPIEKLTIYGMEGSTAQTYAENRDIPFVALSEDPTPGTTDSEAHYGDVDLNGSVSLSDVILINQYILNLGIELNDQQRRNADVDANELLEPFDALNILCCAIELISPEDFPL